MRDLNALLHLYRLNMVESQRTDLPLKESLERSFVGGGKPLVVKNYRQVGRRPRRFWQRRLTPYKWVSLFVVGVMVALLFLWVLGNSR